MKYFPMSIIETSRVERSGSCCGAYFLPDRKSKVGILLAWLFCFMRSLPPVVGVKGGREPARAPPVTGFATMILCRKPRACKPRPFVCQDRLPIPSVRLLYHDCLRCQDHLDL